MEAQAKDLPLEAQDAADIATVRSPLTGTELTSAASGAKSAGDPFLTPVVVEHDGRLGIMANLASAHAASKLEQVGLAVSRRIVDQRNGDRRDCVHGEIVRILRGKSLDLWQLFEKPQAKFLRPFSFAHSVGIARQGQAAKLIGVLCFASDRDGYLVVQLDVC
jgi:hypothetical protein